MLSEALDIIIESRGDTIWLVLTGSFNKEQIPNIRTKIEDFMIDGCRHIVVNIEQITSIHENVAPMFLSMLNSMKGKNGDIKFVFKNETVTAAFAPYRNLFTVFPDIKSVNSNNFIHTIRRRGLLLTKKTGIRVSVPVAIFILFIVTGWFISLGIIINMQSRQQAIQNSKIKEYQQWKQNAIIEIDEFKKRLTPMKQLGLLVDTLSK